MSDTGSPAAPQKPLDRLLWRLACLLVLVGMTLSLVHFLSQKAWAFALFGTVGAVSTGGGMLVYGVVVFRELRFRKVL